jgi:hypothetical protein
LSDNLLTLDETAKRKGISGSNHELPPLVLAPADEAIEQVWLPHTHFCIFSSPLWLQRPALPARYLIAPMKLP